MAMILREYRKRVDHTAAYPKALVGAHYLPALGLVAECGEYAMRVLPASAKDDKGREGRINELGDILWYLSQFAKEYGMNLETINRRSAKHPFNYGIRRDADVDEQRLRTTMGLVYAVGSLASMERKVAVDEVKPSISELRGRCVVIFDHLTKLAELEGTDLMHVAKYNLAKLHRRAGMRLHSSGEELASDTNRDLEDLYLNDFSGYQEHTRALAIYPNRLDGGQYYAALALSGEAAAFVEGTVGHRGASFGKLGDLLLYFSILSKELGISVEDLSSETRLRMRDKPKIIDLWPDMAIHALNLVAEVGILSDRVVEIAWVPNLAQNRRLSKEEATERLATIFSHLDSFAEILGKPIETIGRSELQMMEWMYGIQSERA